MNRRVSPTAPKSIQALLEQSVHRRWRHLAAERLDTIKPVIPLGPKFWELTRQERQELEKLFSQDDFKKMVTKLQSRDDNEVVELVDAAYWMKGCSSLGRLRYVVMLRVGKGKGASLCLVDVKEAVTPAAPRLPEAQMPPDNAMRVVAGAKALSPNLGERMMAGRLPDKAVVLRELMPQDLKIEIDRLNQDDATALAAYLAGVVGRAHGLKELHKTRTTSLDAPSWLWSSVVDLLSVHEAAYLEHCRRFALEQVTQSRRM